MTGCMYIAWHSVNGIEAASISFVHVLISAFLIVIECVRGIWVCDLSFLLLVTFFSVLCNLP